MELKTSLPVGELLTDHLVEMFDSPDLPSVFLEELEKRGFQVVPKPTDNGSVPSDAQVEEFTKLTTDLIVTFTNWVIEDAEGILEDDPRSALGVYADVWPRIRKYFHEGWGIELPEDPVHCEGQLISIQEV